MFVLAAKGQNVTKKNKKKNILSLSQIKTKLPNTKMTLINSQSCNQNKIKSVLKTRKHFNGAICRKQNDIQ